MRTKEKTKNENIISLSKEHHFISLFSWKIKRGLKNGVSAARICEYVRYFWNNHLNPHFLEEEKLLFIPLNTRGVQRAIRDHTIIRKQIMQVLSNEKKETKKLLLQLTELLDEHRQFEERYLFPILERKLERQPYEDDEPQIKRSHSQFLDEYKDEFWN